MLIIVLDASKELDDEDKELLEITKDKERIIVYNKKDLSDTRMDNTVYVSAIQHDVKELVDEINSKFAEHKIALERPTLSNERHIASVRKSYLAMQRAQEALKMGIELDLVTSDLNEAYIELASVIMPREDINVLDEIFSRFCLGK